MKETNLPKKQHYIPQFYLKHFSQDKNKLWMYDKQSNNAKNIKWLTTKSIAFENNFYTYESIEKTNETLEDMFCQMEALAANVIDKITNGVEINQQEKADISVFYGFLWLRTPQSKKKLNAMTTNLYEQVSRKSILMTPNKNIKDFFASKGMKMTDEEVDEMKDFASDEKRSRFELNIPQNYWIKQMLHLGMDVTPVFQMCNWELCVAEKPYAFITSDCPFMLIPSKPIHPFYGLGLLTPGAKKIIPLTSKICLVMHEPEEKPTIIYRKVNKDFYKMINKFIYNKAERFVFSPDEGKLSKLVNHKY